MTVADYHQLLLLLCPDFPEWVVSKAAEAIPTSTDPLAPADGVPRKVCLSARKRRQQCCL